MSASTMMLSDPPIPTHYIRRCGKKSDLFWSLRHILRFGKIFGLFSFTKVHQGDPFKVKFRYSIFTVWSILPTLALLISLVLGIVSLIQVTAKTAGHWALTAENTAFFICTVVCFTHFLRNGEGYVSLFQKWAENPPADPTLSRDATLLCSVVLSGVLENLVWTYATLADYEGRPKDGISLLENFFMKTGPHPIPYHPAFSIFFIICNKLGLYAWTVSDTFVMILARATSGKFKAFNEMAERVLRYNPSLVPGLIAEHKQIRAFLEEVKHLLSPIIFTLYATNLFFICLKIHLAVTENKEKSFWASLYAVWAFLHLLLKIVLTTVIGSRITLYATKFGDMLQDLPDEYESLSVTKTRQILQLRKFGLSGLGCFLITPQLLLKMLSFVFTFEIVLLQSTIQQNQFNYAIE